LRGLCLLKLPQQGNLNINRQADAPHNGASQPKTTLLADDPPQGKIFLSIADIS
jgi:hypothetical protein